MNLLIDSVGWARLSPPGSAVHCEEFEIMPAEDPIAARLLASLEGLDLTSADGRAGLHTPLSEIERACPGVILQQAARIELRALGWDPTGR